MSLHASLLKLSLLLFLVVAGAARADEFWLSGSEDGVALPAYHEMLEDESGKLGSDDLAVAERAGRFVQLDRTPLNFGYSKSAFWFKAVLVNPTKKEIEPWLEVGPARLQQVSLYLRRRDHMEHFEAGSARDFDSRPIRSRLSVFPFRVEPGETVTLYVRVASETAISVETRLWTGATFRAAEAQNGLWNGLLLGVMIALLLCGLILFHAFGKRAFLFHALSLLAYLLYEMGNRGYSFMLLWPHATTWSTHSLALFGALASICRILFMREFLQTRRVLPRWDPLLLLLIYTQVVAAAYSQLIDYRQGAWLSTLSGAVALTVCVLLGVLALARGQSAARIYLAATALLIVGAMARYLEFLGMAIPETLSSSGTPLAAILAATLLLAAMIEDLIRSQRKVEAAQDQMLSAKEEQRRQLEHAVHNRTLQLNNALRQAESESQAKTTLLAHISHDLRAPLATIIGYARRLRRQAGAPDARYAIAIEKSAQHQLVLIDELLEFSQDGHHGMRLVARPLCLHAFLQDIAQEGEFLALQQHNRFSLQLADALPRAVMADPKRLRQVLLNLLSNAAKFTNEGDIALAVEVDSAAPPRPGSVLLRFEVNDTGRGIAEEDCTRIFEPFQRGASAAGTSGVGLGLGIARLIVDSAGGQLQMSSVVGQGSRFFFSMPFDRAAEADGLCDAESGAEIQGWEAHPSLHPGTWTAVPAVRLAQLQHFVEHGLVTEIEEWIAATQTEAPELADLTSRLDQALKNLDFKRLAQLAQLENSDK